MPFRIPRLTKSIFLDQFILMQLAGVLIGITAPFFWWWYGFAAEQVFVWDFFLTAILGGQMVGLVSFLLISTVIRPHLKLLANNMREIADHLEDKTFNIQEARCAQGICTINVDSHDEIGVSATAYNKLLQALIKSHDLEQVINQFSKVISENLEESKLVEDTIDLLVSSSHIDGAAILVSKQGELEVAGSRGILDAKELVNHDEVENAIRTGKSSYLQIPSSVSLDGILTSFPPSEVFLEPIDFKGVHLGVLVAATGAQRSDDRTKQLLTFFSRSIGLALNNAMTHSKFQRMAAIDSLTNVYNRRFGMARLKEEFSRVVREQSLVSIAMIDIDHFKKVNDTYGHLVGDRAIILVASILEDSIRKGDIVCRYGGEEFMLVLSGCSCDNAYRLSETIRNKVKDVVFKEGEHQIPLTVSIGVASYPDINISDEVELLGQADEALYKAKQTGRDKVITASGTN